VSGVAPGGVAPDRAWGGVVGDSSGSGVVGSSLIQAVRDVALALDAAGVPSPRVDAEHIVAHVLGISRSTLYSSSAELTESEWARVRSLLDRRRRREPLAYVLGEWGFRRLTLAVDRRALVPRPETEIVVERCLVLLRDVGEPRVLDVGVGSGAIALALVDEHPGARVVAVDRSEDALALARVNIERTGADGRVELVHGDLLGGLEGPFDLVVSNPPYVLPDEYDSLQPEVRLYEPRDALVGVGVGEEIARRALGVLRPGGRLVLECADTGAAGLAEALRDLGYADVTTTPDLAGRLRVVDARRP
jgi:release factor glutamine methyltransferase